MDLGEWGRDLIDNGEHERQMLQQMQEDLRSEYLSLYDNRAPWLLANIDSFISMTRCNEIVEEVDLYLYVYDDNEDAACYDIWDKVGQGIGNLEALETLHVLVSGDPDSGTIENDQTPDWERLGYILTHLGKTIRLQVDDASETEGHHLRYAIDVDGFSRMLRWQRMVTRFGTGDIFYRGSLGTVCAALSMLPALVSVDLGHRKWEETEQGAEATVLDPEHVTMLLRASSLRYVEFKHFDFTNFALCQATANTLREKESAITKLTFWNCNFAAGGDAEVMSCLETNKTLTSMEFNPDPNDTTVVCNALASSLCSNSSLETLTLRCPYLTPVFRSMTRNTGLKTLVINGRHGRDLVMDEDMSTAMRLGLGGNSSLTNLIVTNVPVAYTAANDADIAQWCKGLQFLRKNTALKSLEIRFRTNSMPPMPPAVCNAIASSLCFNSSLQELTLDSCSRSTPELFRSLQRNTGLKSLVLWGVVMDEDLCEAMQFGLGGNSTLDSLKLARAALNGTYAEYDAGTAQWCRALQFLRTNTVLKSLEITFSPISLDDFAGSEVDRNDLVMAMKQRLSTARKEIVAMLRDNKSLEFISIFRFGGRSQVPTIEEYFDLLKLLQDNTALKAISLQQQYVFATNPIAASRARVVPINGESKQLASLLKKNYALDSLPDIDFDPTGDLGVILRLNGAGRRYLIHDEGSVSKGVDVLSAVNDDLNCLMFHLLENPELCTRSNKAMRIGNGGSTSASTHLLENPELCIRDKAMRRGDGGSTSATPRGAGP
jgi:hypothetical protein